MLSEEVCLNGDSEVATQDKLSMKKYVFRWRRRRTEAFETDVGLNPSTWHQPHFSLL